MKKYATLLLILVMFGCMNWKDTMRKEYVNANPNLAPRYKECILAGAISPGMTTEMVENTWGIPNRQYHAQVRGHNCEIWIYRSAGSHHYVQRIYFENGRVIGCGSNF